LARVEPSLAGIGTTGYTRDDCHVSQHEGRITITPLKKHYPPDTTACIFWLKNRRPQEWRYRTELDTEQEVAGVPNDVLEGLRKVALQTL